MIVFCDTETTGIGPTARVIQIAMDLCMDDGRTVATLNTIVNQETPCHTKALEVHGITNAMQANGIDRYIAGNLISKIAAEAHVIIGHNIPFDIEMCKQSFISLYLPFQSYCTMRQLTPVCKIPSPKGGLKWPKLSEAYRHFFNEDFANAHDAWADVQACKRLYFKCKELGL